jgi:hypothetical protein
MHDVSGVGPTPVFRRLVVIVLTDFYDLFILIFTAAIGIEPGTF